MAKHRRWNGELLDDPLDVAGQPTPWERVAERVWEGAAKPSPATKEVRLVMTRKQLRKGCPFHLDSRSRDPDCIFCPR